MPLRELSRGEVVAGRYEVFRVLQRGRTGTVYAAENKSVGRPCALEVVAVDGEAPPSGPRFLEAMRAVGRIGTHPNVAEFFDAGTVDELNTPYLAMELVEGEALDAYVKAKRCLPKVIGALLGQVGGALATAHAAGVVHGELEPGNVLVIDGPTAKVLDFGVARALGIASGFSAPEQLPDALRAEARSKGFAVSDEVGPAADVFGLGLLAYVLFTGQSIGDYWGVSDVAEMNQRLATTPRSPASQKAGVSALKLPPGFDAWFERATAFDPAKRHPSIEAAVSELAKITGSSGITKGLGSAIPAAPAGALETGPTGFAPLGSGPTELPPLAAAPTEVGPTGFSGASEPVEAGPPATERGLQPPSNAPGPSSAPPPAPGGPSMDQGPQAFGPPGGQGAQMPSAPPPAQPPQWGPPMGQAQPAPQKGSGAAILIGAIVLGLLLVVGGGFAYTMLKDSSVAQNDDDGDGRRAKKKKKKADPSPTPVSVPRSHTTASVPVDDEDPSWGQHDAPATIVVFSDYQCPYCGRVEGTLSSLKTKYGAKQLRIVWKDFPLPFHKDAKPAHEAARAVFLEGGATAFWKFHDKAFAHQSSLDVSNFETWAKAAGVPSSAISKHSAKAERKVDDNIALGKTLGVRGTPAFFINGVFLSGARPQSSFESEIDSQISAAKALVKSGTRETEVYPTLTAKNFSKPTTPSPSPSPSPPSSTDVWKVPVSKDDPSWGPSDALVTIVEFSEFQCPFCAKVRKALTTVKSSYPKDVRIVWKDHPLPFHKRALPAAIVGREAFEQKGSATFWKLHDILFDNQKALEDADLLGYAGKVGLNTGKVKAALASNAHKAFIDASELLSQDVKASGTPHFFINGRRLMGAQPFSAFETLIDEELKKARARVASGTARADLYAEIMKTAKTESPFEEKKVSAAPPDAPFKGNPKGTIVVQLFSDFQCPFCSRINTTLEALVKGNADVKLVWRHNPLAFHKDAPLAHEAALEAYAQKGNKGFWQMHDLLFANQKALGRADLEKYAGDMGLDLTKFRKALDTRKHQKRVDQDQADASSAGIRGTPACVVDRWFLSGAQPLSKFERAVAHARANP